MAVADVAAVMRAGRPYRGAPRFGATLATAVRG
jgi:hypothetical protein